MDGLFASGRIVDLILLGVAVEALLLFFLRRRFGAFPALAANLASGAALMLALRAALTGADWPMVAAWLLAALVAHVADLVLRRRADASPQHGPRRVRNHGFWDAFKRGKHLKRY